MLRAPGNTALGNMPLEQEAQLGQVISKRPGTIDYDYPGAGYFARKGTTTDQGIVPKNVLYFRQDTYGLYQPVVPIIVSAAGGSRRVKVKNEEKNKLGALGVADSKHRVWFFDFSADAWVEPNTNVTLSTSTAPGADDGAGTDYAYITLSAQVSDAITIASDLMFVGDGVEKVRNWVLFDQIVDLRSTAKPSAHAADIINSFIYEGRLKQSAIANWDDFAGEVSSTTAKFQDHIKDKCQRLFIDTP